MAFSTHSFAAVSNNNIQKNETSSQHKRFWQATARSDVECWLWSWFLSFVHLSQHRRIRRQTCDTIYAFLSLLSPVFPNIFRIKPLDGENCLQKDKKELETPTTQNTNGMCCEFCVPYNVDYILWYPSFKASNGSDIKFYK